MRNQHVIILAGAALLILAGCGSSSSSPSPSPDPNSVSTVFSADPNGDAVDTLDAATLGADIDSIFGGENAEPVAVNPGDTIGDVLDRAKNG